MTKAVLTAISGVDIYASLSLGLFMSFFIGMLIWVVGLRKPHLQHMQHLPLDAQANEAGDSDHVQR